MKRVLISNSLVLAFITLVFTQATETGQMAQTLKLAQTDRQLVDTRSASNTTAANKVDALLAPWSRAQDYNRVSEKTVKPIRGKKLVLTGVVRDGDEVLYRFRARAGQRVTVRVVGRDADFTAYLNYGLDVEAVANDTKSWSLTMPREFNGHCEIALHSTYKLADYRLEILLK